MTIMGHSKRGYIAEKVRRLLGGTPSRIQVAALPWRTTARGVEVMLITSRETRRWVLPKGWPEGNEQLWDAAAREALEEAGLVGRIAHRELGRYYYAKLLRSGAEKRCEVHVFPMRIDEVREEWPERKQRERQWFSPKQAALSVRERDLAELIQDFGRDPSRFAA
jgi:8-oxo-dGTP pyrophosphatase MutT (NUDIX family)